MITLTKEAAQSVLDALEGVTAYTALLDDFTMVAAKESAEVLQAAINAPELSGERSALIERLRRNVDYLDGTQVLIDTMQEAADMLAADAPEQEPMFWVRICSDGMYEGPIHNARIEEVRKQSGVWKPLYLATPAPQAREPLTDDRLIELIEPLIYKEASDLEIARAIQTAVLAASSKP